MVATEENNNARSF